MSDKIGVFLLSSHRPSPIRGLHFVDDWCVNESFIRFSSFGGRTIGTLKSVVARYYQIPIDEQHWYSKKLTLEQTQSTDELEDTVVVNRLSTKEFSVIIEPRSLTPSTLKWLLPHISETNRQALLIRLQPMPIGAFNLLSIREAVSVPEKLMDVIIRNHTAGILVDNIIIDDQHYFPQQIDPTTKLVKFRCNYTYQYSVASDEYAREVKEANVKYVSDVVHCKKLPHDLPIALANSQIKLVEETKAVREKVPGLELSDLGALLVEQSVITDEIKAQEERLPQLKPVVFEKSRFSTYVVHSQIELHFGWHQFNDIIYELIHTPIPNKSEIKESTSCIHQTYTTTI